jgi:hypothetical protein
MHDDDLIDRLRRAAADVPASTLDLGAVLRSARRKQMRHRSAVATGCVAAVAGAGMVAPALPGLLPPDGVADGGPAALLAGGCVVEASIDLDDVRLEPQVRAVRRVEVAADGSISTEDTVRNEPTPQMGASGDMPEAVRQAVLDLAREQDEAGIYRDGDLFDEMSQLRVGAPASGTDEVERSVEPLGGFVEAMEGLPPLPDVADLASPGVFVVWDQGVRHVVGGRAGCDGDQQRFRLSYVAPETTGLLDCGEVVETAVEWAVKETQCPDGTSQADTDATGIVPDDVAGLLSMLGLVPAFGR